MGGALGGATNVVPIPQRRLGELLNQTVLLCICCYVHVLCMIRVPSKRILWGGNVGSERGNTMIGVAAQ